MTNLCTCGSLNAVQTCFGCISIICEILIYVFSVHGTFPQCPFIIHLNRVIITNQHATFVGYICSNHHVWMFGRQIRCNSWTLFGNLSEYYTDRTACQGFPYFILENDTCVQQGSKETKALSYIAIAWYIHISLSLTASDQSYLIPAASLLPQSNQMHNWYSNINK